MKRLTIFFVSLFVASCSTFFVKTRQLSELHKTGRIEIKGTKLHRIYTINGDSLSILIKLKYKKHKNKHKKHR